MEILWPALGISVIVVFVFYVLAQHWQKILGEHSWIIRELARRVQDLEEMGDPEFRRRVNESAPVPLEEVFHFNLRLADRFWRDALHLTEENRSFVRAFGSFVGSVKLERWRSHIVATVTEVLPDPKASAWRTRSLDFYPDGAEGREAITLWEVPLQRAAGDAARPPSLELLLSRDLIELRGNSLGETLPSRPQGESATGEVSFLQVPLDAVRLTEFRTEDPLARSDHSANGEPLVRPNLASPAGAWQTFYSGREETLGIEWELRVRDLNKKAEWERWRILETASAGSPF